MDVIISYINIHLEEQAKDIYLRNPIMSLCLLKISIIKNSVF